MEKEGEDNGLQQSRYKPYKELRYETRGKNNCDGIR